MGSTKTSRDAIRVTRTEEGSVDKKQLSLNRKTNHSLRWAGSYPMGVVDMSIIHTIAGEGLFLSACATQNSVHASKSPTLSRLAREVLLSPEHLQVVCQPEPAVIMALKPIVEVNLIEVRSDDLFAQFVDLSAQEWNV